MIRLAAHMAAGFSSFRTRKLSFAGPTPAAWSAPTIVGKRVPPSFKARHRTHKEIE